MKNELIRDIIQWDVKSWSEALNYWENTTQWETVRTGLELGAYKGGLSLWLGLKGLSVVCSNIKDTKANAESLHLKYGLNKTIEYIDIDATEIPFENHFDLIALKSVIGGIGEMDMQVKQKVINQIYKALKPGGKLLFAENLSGTLLHKKLREKFIPWNNQWKYFTIDEINNLLHDFRFKEIKTTGITGTFGRTEKQRTLLSSLDKVIFNKICPENWHYIAYGMAIK